MAINNADADADDLVSIVSVDASLAAQIVGWASSAYYSAPGEIKSIQDAMVRVLGFDATMSLCLGLALGKALSIPEVSPIGITPYWQQSVYCALTMERLNRALPPKKRGTPGFAYLAGLLNNLGFLIVAHVFPGRFRDYCRIANANRHINPCYIENYLLGITREAICSEILNLWCLPEEICVAVRYQQHADYEADHALYANLLFVAKRLLAAKGIGDCPPEVIPVEMYERLGLSPEVANDIICDIMEQAPDIEAMADMFVDQNH